MGIELSVVILIMAIVMVITAFIVVMYRRIKHRKTCEICPWIDAIGRERYKAAVLSLGPAPAGPYQHQGRRFKERLAAAKQRYQQAVTMQTEENAKADQIRLERLTAAHNELQTALALSDTNERYKALVKLFDRYILVYSQHDMAQDDHEQLRETVRELTRQRADDLLEQARQGDARSMAKLINLTKSSSNPRCTPYYDRVREEYLFPADWNQLVTRHIENPRLLSFVLKDQPDAGDVRLMAATALRTHSLVFAKIVLAYANQSVEGARSHSPRRYPWREEVGDVLLAELAKLVEAHHASQITLEK